MFNTFLACIQFQVGAFDATKKVEMRFVWQWIKEKQLARQPSHPTELIGVAPVGSTVRSDHPPSCCCFMQQREKVENGIR